VRQAGDAPAEYGAGVVEVGRQRRQGDDADPEGDLDHRIGRNDARG
jgi:hypothetical protein